MNKLALVLLAVLAAPAALLAADVIAQYKMDRDVVLESLYYSARGTLTAPQVTTALKALPPAQRAAAATQLCQFAKTYYTSDAFKRKYAADYTAVAPVKPTPPTKISDEQVDQQQKQIDQAMEMAKQQMDNLPPEMQEQMRKSMAEAKDKSKGMKDESHKQQAKAQEEYEAALKKYNEDLAKTPPKDPNQAVKKMLTNFLAITAGVDYAAQVKDRRFVNKDYEAKPAEWKMAYRAGREATEAARAFAKKWIAEIK